MHLPLSFPLLRVVVHSTYLRHVPEPVRLPVLHSTVTAAGAAMSGKQEGGDLLHSRSQDFSNVRPSWSETLTSRPDLLVQSLAAHEDSQASCRWISKEKELRSDPKPFLHLTAAAIRKQSQHATALGKIKFQQEGYFGRAVEFVEARLLETVGLPHTHGSVGRELLEGFLAYSRLEQRTLSNEWVEQLIEASHTDYYSYQALAFFAQITPDHEKLPALKTWRNNRYLGIYKAPPRPRGRHEFANYFRDRAICMAIRDLVGLGFTATRSHAAAGDSACDVVTEALARMGQAISYDAVEKVWVRRERLTPGTGGVQLANDLALHVLDLLSETKPD